MKSIYFYEDLCKLHDDICTLQQKLKAYDDFHYYETYRILSCCLDLVNMSLDSIDQICPDIPDSKNMACSVCKFYKVCKFEYENQGKR